MCSRGCPTLRQWLMNIPHAEYRPNLKWHHLAATKSFGVQLLVPGTSVLCPIADPTISASLASNVVQYDLMVATTSTNHPSITCLLADYGRLTKFSRRSTTMPTTLQHTKAMFANHCLSHVCSKIAAPPTPGQASI